MFARACASTIVAASAALTLTATANAVTCPTIGETLPVGMYVASTNGELWRVNPRKGSHVADAAFVGVIRNDTQGFYPTDIAFNDDGSLYGVDGFDLFCMSPADGTAVAIGGSEFDPPWQTALAGRTFSLGQLYGAGQDQLLQIQVGNGKGTPTSAQYGPLSCGTETGDLVFDADSDVLLGTVDCVGGGLPDRSQLVTVDPTSGQVLTSLGTITDTHGEARYGVFGLAFGPDGSLFAGTEATLMRIDPRTGASYEDYTILSTTPGKVFDRVDGMTSRVCEPMRPKPRRLTAGQWRQECRDGLDPALAAEVDPMVAWVTEGLITETCDALRSVDARGTIFSDDAAPQADAKAEVMTEAGRRGSRTDVFVAKAAGGNGRGRGGGNDQGGGGQGGMETLCALGLRELTAAALNVASGRANSACPHCEEGPMGRYLDQLTNDLHTAIADGDAQTCNMVKREAHHIVADVCEDAPGDNGGGNDGVAKAQGGVPGRNHVFDPNTDASDQ